MDDYMKEAERLADAIVREVAELPDRDSPADWPAAMLVTSDELRGIVLAHIQRGVPDGWHLDESKARSAYWGSYPDGDSDRCDVWMTAFRWVRAMLAAPAPDHFRDAAEIVPEFSDTARAALLWVLWHHQGGSSPVGQPIRFALGMGQHERLSDWQLSEARRWGELRGLVPGACREPAPATADVPMPKPENEARMGTEEGGEAYTAGYFDGEATGYARGLRNEDMFHDLTVALRALLDMPDNENTKRHARVLLRRAEDALRGEVKT